MASAKLDAAQLEFQDYARRWLEENRPPPPPVRLPITPIEVMTEAQRDYLQEWQRQCYDAGLVGCDVPEGRTAAGATRASSASPTRSSPRRACPSSSTSWASAWPCRRSWCTAPRSRSGSSFPARSRAEEIWCQGFSEPGAGSDMANQQTTAERRGDVWIVNGHKVWTSLGHFAKWMILMARTSRDHKYDGLTYFLCPIEGHPASP